MSIEAQPLPTPPNGFPELTALGKRIEVLRIQRGLSKQHLARGAGTSRQQLWRVSTGKSELTAALRQRLADVLGVDPTALRDGAGAPAPMRLSPQPASPLGDSLDAPTRATPRPDTRSPRRPPGGEPAASAWSVGDLRGFVRAPHRIEAAIALLPGGPDGRRIKRGLLDAIEDVALDRGLTLGADFFDLRRRVLAGEL